jgi:hypothetical protein
VFTTWNVDKFMVFIVSCWFLCAVMIPVQYVQQLICRKGLLLFDADWGWQVHVLPDPCSSEGRHCSCYLTLNR